MKGAKMDFREVDKKIKGKRAKGKVEEVIQTSFFITSEGLICEEIYIPEINQPQFAVFDGESVKYAETIRDQSVIIKPIQGEIIKKGVIKLPSEAEEYQSELELFNRIKVFIHKYVDIKEDWENWAAYYVLLSWVYDKLPVCPYLCALGPSDAGKTRFVQTIGAICYKPFTTSGSATPSPIFRVLDQFRGTLIVNEFDHIGDFNLEIIVIFNNGYEAGLPVIRTEGERKKEVKVFQVFGPKIFSSRKRKSDWAFESRLLTVQMRQTKRKDISPFLLEDFHWETQELRNMLLMFRFRHYKKQVTFHNELFEGITGRLRQTLLSITSVIDDPIFLTKAKQFANELKRDLTNIKGFDLDTIIYQILKDFWDKGEEKPAIKDITVKAKELSEIEKLTPKAVGGIVRDELGFKTDRGGATGNYVAYLTKEQLDYLRDRYEDFDETTVNPKQSSDSSVSSEVSVPKTESTEDTELLKTPIDKLSAAEQLRLGKATFGEGTRWEDEK